MSSLEYKERLARESLRHMQKRGAGAAA